MHPAWSPIGAGRFVELVNADYFSDVALFRCIEGFICQFGIAAKPEINTEWKTKGAIQDDPHILVDGGLMKRGMLSFAGGGANSRTTQLFVALRDSQHIGLANWETPVGQVIEGMDVVEQWYKGYGDSSRHGGNAPEQSTLTHKGSAFIRTTHPLLDFLQSCKVSGAGTEDGLLLDAEKRAAALGALAVPTATGLSPSAPHSRALP